MSSIGEFSVYVFANPEFVNGPYVSSYFDIGLNPSRGKSN